MRCRVLVLVALLAPLAAEARAQSDLARVKVRLPADAKLYVDNVLCPIEGEVRSFDARPTPPGQKYAYVLRAEVTEGDRTLSLSKKVTFKAGETVTVEFGDRAAFLAAMARADGEPPLAGPALPLPAAPKPVKVQGPAPHLINARLDKDGSLVAKVVQQVPVTEQYSVKVKGPDGKDREETRTVTKMVSQTFDQKYGPKTTKVYRADGSPVPAARWEELFAQPTPVLVCHDGKMPDPFYLRFLNDETLILVPDLQAPMPAPVVPVPPPPVEKPKTDPMPLPLPKP